MKIFNSHHRVGFIWICVLAAALLLGGRLWEAWQWNWTGLRLMKGQEASIPLTPPGCSHISHIWLVGMMAGKRGDLPAQRQAFEQALKCSSNYLSLIQAVLPEDLEIARLATQQYPENSKAWYWLGQASAPTDPFAAQQAYLRTLTLDPHNDWAWYRVGRNYELNGEFEMAGEAYLKCCLNGDPGSNGCWGAGRMMEKLGNLQQAIEYYRLSRWEKALERAQELEKQLSP
jgi:tetratricopeptide (TPR) repeat protein